MRLRLIALAPFVLLGTLCAHADITYVYTGAQYDVLVGKYSANDRLTGYFTLPGPTDPNVTLDQFFEVYPLAFSFSDGIQTINQTNATLVEFAPITTDDLGYIVDYEFFMQSATGYIAGGTVDTYDPGTGQNLDSVGVLDSNDYAYSFEPGTLVLGTPPAITPEPSSFALLGTGLLGVSGVVRKRFA